MQGAVLNIRKFDFNCSQFHRLDGDRLLDNTQFPVEGFTIHSFSPSMRLAYIWCRSQPLSLGKAHLLPFFATGWQKKSGTAL
jgi:hypothetical protein